MRRLDVEGLFDFGVGCYEEVKEDNGGDYGKESNICREELTTALNHLAI